MVISPACGAGWPGALRLTRLLALPPGPGVTRRARLRAASPFAGPFASGLSHALLSDELSLRHGVLWFRLWPSLGQPAQHPRPVGRALAAGRIGYRFPATAGRLGLSGARGLVGGHRLLVGRRRPARRGLAGSGLAGSGLAGGYRLARRRRRGTGRDRHRVAL